MDVNFALAADPAAWAALVTLVAMEVVLGIDNLIFISILTNKLPEHQRASARRITGSATDDDVDPAGLEERLGIQLLNRTTRRVATTEAGRTYHQYCVRILADAEAAEQAAGALHREPRGTLRISAPDSFGWMHVAPAVPAFLKRYPDLAGKKLKTFTEMWKMFEDPSIDAISNALGDRWHSLSTIWACQAGKDVYVEKPGTTNLFEGRQMVAAARKYECIVQHGTQNRSSPNIREGMQKLREGAIGELYMARAIDYKITGNLGRIRPAPVPAGLDWDKWLGPKPMRPYSEFWHRRWMYIPELANGGFANQIIHELDMVRWGLGLDEHPTEVNAVGGKFVHDDDSTDPSNIAATSASW